MILTVEDDGFTIEDANIFYLNFEGKEGDYNAEGQRSFCAEIPLEAVDSMIERGWNIKFTKPADPSARIAYINIAVNFKNRPPRIIVLSGENRVRLDEETVGLLDNMEFDHVDFTINTHHWANKMGGSGIKPYLASMYATLHFDRLRTKYNDESI